MIGMASRNINNLHKDGNEENSIEDDKDTDENTNCETFVLLTDMVRKHYCNYLEKQLQENMNAWRANMLQNNKCGKYNLELMEKATLKKCCRQLEDKALKACMHARRYQRSMLKTISEVRRRTQEFRLEDELKKLIVTDGNVLLLKNQNQKATQTDGDMCCLNTPDVSTPNSLPLQDKIEIFQDHLKQAEGPCSLMTERNPSYIDQGGSLSLQRKIDMFQEHLNQATASKLAATHNISFLNMLPDSMAINNHLTKVKHEKYSKPLKFNNTYQKRSDLGRKKEKIKPLRSLELVTGERDEKIKKTPPPVNNITEPVPCVNDNHLNSTLKNQIDATTGEEDDEIALELAQLFSEEKTELEELLGLNSNSEVDDPQVRSVLEEIENASLRYECKETQSDHKQNIDSSPSKQNHHQSPIIESNSPNLSTSSIHNCHNNTLNQIHTSTTSQIVKTASNLRQSIWPCELYMQRRRLSASLSRLLEEDFRWHDLIKWKFHTFFGEDSDDEFAPCSPSIDLDEILICSCIQRISPWMVKHLMKPMRAGLIANRFLFKKLAKRLAHSIIMENQYPNERFIKHAVEEYFCLHQAVVSLEDLVDMPNLKAIQDNSDY